MSLLGISVSLSAALFFGSVFVPIKRKPTGDERKRLMNIFACLFSQLGMSLGGFCFALFVHLVLGCPPLYPLAMAGGIAWCLANAVAMQLMSVLGMALAVLIWNTSSCITGWAIARFGLFGITAQQPASNLLNLTGVMLLVAGGSFYLFVKNNKDDAAEASEADIPKELEATGLANVGEGSKFSCMRIIAIVGALVSGLFYGVMCTPVTYIQQHSSAFGNAPLAGLPYLFSFFCGVIGTSVIVFLVYAMRMRGHPFVDGTVLAPALCSGMLFAAGMASFFVALEQLSQAIAYPVVTMLPGLVTTAWSVLYFKEITGKRNLLFLAAAYGLTFVGVLLVTISKDLEL